MLWTDVECLAGSGREKRRKFSVPRADFDSAVPTEWMRKRSSRHRRKNWLREQIFSLTELRFVRRTENLSVERRVCLADQIILSMWRFFRFRSSHRLG